MVPICPKCQIVFEKFNAHQKAILDSQTVLIDQSRPILTEQKDITKSMLVVRWITLVALVLFSLRLIGPPMASNAAGESFLHLINLPFHEAGHIFFRPFGAFITSLGGTLGQLLMPLICLLTLFLKTRDPYGSSIVLWWFGENFLDIAPYMNDARSGTLPLLGGNFGHDAPYGFHDWQYLLTESHLIQFDHTLAGATFGVGVLIMFLALSWNGILCWNRFSKK